MLLRIFAATVFILSSSFASAASYRIETKAGVEEILSLVGQHSPGCAMGGICSSEIFDLSCRNSLGTLGKLQTYCSYSDAQNNFYFLGDLESLKLIAYAQVAGLKLTNFSPGYADLNGVKSMICTTVTEMPSSGRLESFVCEFNQ